MSRDSLAWRTRRLLLLCRIEMETMNNGYSKITLRKGNRHIIARSIIFSYEVDKEEFQKWARYQAMEHVKAGGK